MKVGDYVRTKNGEIGKLVNVEVYFKLGQNDQDKFSCVLFDNSFVPCLVRNDFIIKKGQLIDLIEVGDVITFKNDNDVYRVACVPDKELALDDFYLEKNFDGETEDICVEQDTMQKCINSIVTKEMFANAEYRVETN